MKKRTIILVLLVCVLVFACFGALKAFGKDSKGKIRLFSNKVTYKEYKQGDRITFNDSGWIVMYDSSSKDDYLTLISTDILYLGDEDITEVVSGIYETSDINNYLKTKYTQELGVNYLVERNGYKVRLFNEDDFDDLVKSKYNEEDDSYTITDDSDFVCMPNNFYATMIDTEDFEVEDDDEFHLKYYNLVSTTETCSLESVVSDDTLFVRPVINLRKDAIE